jgi:hypothetical protein
MTLALQSTDTPDTNISVDQKFSQAFLAGVDYRVLPARSLEILVDLEALQKVVEIEVFYWYGCHSCLQVELALTNYLKAYPKIKVKRTPLVAHLKWRPQAYIQPILQQFKQLLPDIEMPTNEAVYQACIKDCSVFSSYENTLLWLKEKLQLTELPRLDEVNIWQYEKDARKRADFYSISQVPTIIIRESHSVDANSAKSLTRLINIVDHLLLEVTQP